MLDSLELVAKSFIRSYPDMFTARDMAKIMQKFGFKVSIKDAASYLEMCPYVFPLEQDMYITRSGAFTGKLFSIKPTSREIAQGAFLVGDRMMPFVDWEMLSYGFTFYCGNKKLGRKVVTVDSDFAIDLYQLYGEEYAPQYIAQDPACQSLNLAQRDFELPNRVPLTGFDLGPLVEQEGFKAGDRLLCTVTDWHFGIINVRVLHESNDLFGTGPTARKREEWYCQLEKAMIKSFGYMGPVSSIEEQVANVFFENRDKLCVPYCGSVEEYLLRKNRKVDMEYFGVETRLWKKGEEIPAVGQWNRDELDFISNRASAFVRPDFSGYEMPEYVTDLFLQDMYYRRKNNLPELLDRIYPSDYSFPREFKDRLLLHLKSRNDIIFPQYNWFADKTLGPVRQQALNLYGKAALLVYRIDSAPFSLEKYPQNELVILSQIYAHITKMLETLSGSSYQQSELAVFGESIEGMSWSFEDVRTVLESAIDQQKTQSFKLIK